MIGMDEGSSSARMSRYETGAHEPPFSIAERLASVLKVPAAYFYCDDDRLAEFLICYVVLGEFQKNQVLALTLELSGPAFAGSDSSTSSTTCPTTDAKLSHKS